MATRRVLSGFGYLYQRAYMRLIMMIVGYLLAILVGISLGLLGSGGSILSVPILVYVMGVSPVLATAYSLFAVGVSALVSGVHKARTGLVDFAKVGWFGLPAVVAVLVTRLWLMPALPDSWTCMGVLVTKNALVMGVFALVMIMAAWRMIKPLTAPLNPNAQTPPWLLVGVGLGIGALAGFVGAGGGFLWVPALLFMARLPMPKAIGTSLFIVALQSLIGFAGDLARQPLDLPLMFGFTACALMGVWLGHRLSVRLRADALKTYFGYFVALMGVYILLREALGN